MSEVPTDLRYTEEHEWVLVEDSEDGAVIRFGITDHAQELLGDVVYVTLPAVGATVAAGEPCGEVESTKSVSDLYAPVSGVVTAINGSVDGDPSLVNSAPYSEGWLVEVQVDSADTDPAGDLLDAAGYQRHIGQNQEA